MKRALFIVNTPYQLMVVINMCLNEYKDCEADIIISDRISDYSELAERVKVSGVFKEVYAIELSKIYPQDDKFKALKTAIINKKNIFDKAYDYLLFANLNYDVSSIYRMVKKKNTSLHVCMFEDGYASYSDYYRDFLGIFNGRNVSLGKRVFHKIVDPVFAVVEKMYAFSPEIFTYSYNFSLQKLVPINYKDRAVVELYNRIFGYDSDVDSYDKKVIFFEESYYADGYDSNDIETVNYLADIVGKDKIFVKIHPRNPVNRFKDLGYATNRNTSIPWEVIAMNTDLSDKILITIASVAVIVPAVLLGMDYTGILTMNILDDDSFLKKNITCLYEEICKNSDKLHVVNSKSELRDILLSNI